jgi:ComF family protein
VLRRILDVLFPPSCAGCGSGGPEAWPFCPGCRRELVVLSPPGCAVCGMPAEEQIAGCRHCPPRQIDTARSPFLYTGPARSALLHLKFDGWRSVAEALGRAMAAVATGSAPDLVTWVPLSGKRLAGRGYDQAAALAAAVARTMELPRRRLLVRTRDTDPQTARRGAERRAAMEDAFRAVVRAPPRVLVVDDVLTTGATAAACARALRTAGAEEVHLLTAARAASGPLPARCYARVGSRPSLWLPGTDVPEVDASRRRSDPRKGTVGS